MAYVAAIWVKSVIFSTGVICAGQATATARKISTLFQYTKNLLWMNSKPISIKSIPKLAGSFRWKLGPCFQRLKRTMNRLLVLLLALASAVTAQSSRAQARQADLNFIGTQLPKLHVNFFFQLNPADFNQAVQALAAQISSLTDAEFNVRLAQLVALAGDEHTSLTLNDVAAANAGFQQLPLQFRWLDDGVFVPAASSRYSRALGAKLVAVGSHPIQEVFQQLAPVIPHSHLNWVRYIGQSYLRGQQILQGLDLVPATPTTTLVFQDSIGQQFSLDVAPSGES